MSHTIVIFGASGDLTSRKLIPAIYHLFRKGRLPESTRVVGVSRSHFSHEDWRKELAESTQKHAGDAFDPESWERFSQSIYYQPGDIQKSEDFEALAGFLKEIEPGGAVDRVYYLSTMPQLYPKAAEQLGQAGLADDANGNRRIIIEKPFGSDYDSARQLNDDLHRFFREDQVYRIDHYLGKETVQNLLGFRFHNAIFEPVWNRNHVELVQITVAEQIGVEPGRAGFYDQTGALRDLVQNHMLQILALAAMEPPPSLEAEAVRDQKVALLRGLCCFGSGEIRDRCVRARYAAGEIDGEEVPGYLDQEDVSPDSQTETYVALRAEIRNWRWEGVPFLLRHGKRLAERFTEIEIQFRKPPLQLFDRSSETGEAGRPDPDRETALCRIRPNRLTLRLQPDEGIRIAFGVKEPGSGMRMSPATLDFDYREHFEESPQDAYQRVLLDALRGDGRHEPLHFRRLIDRQSERAQHGDQPEQRSLDYQQRVAERRGARYPCEREEDEAALP